MVHRIESRNYSMSIQSADFCRKYQAYKLDKKNLLKVVWANCMYERLKLCPYPSVYIKANTRLIKYLNVRTGNMKLLEVIGGTIKDIALDVAFLKNNPKTQAAKVYYETNGII